MEAARAAARGCVLNEPSRRMCSARQTSIALGSVKTFGVMSTKTASQERAFHFLREKFYSQESFTAEQFQNETGFAALSFATYTKFPRIAAETKTSYMDRIAQMVAKKFGVIRFIM